MPCLDALGHELLSAAVAAERRDTPPGIMNDLLVALAQLAKATRGDADLLASVAVARDALSAWQRFSDVARALPAP